MECDIFPKFLCSWVCSTFWFGLGDGFLHVLITTYLLFLSFSSSKFTQDSRISVQLTYNVLKDFHPDLNIDKCNAHMLVNNQMLSSSYLLHLLSDDIIFEKSNSISSYHVFISDIIIFCNLFKLNVIVVV